MQTGLIAKTQNARRRYAKTTLTILETRFMCSAAVVKS